MIEVLPGVFLTKSQIKAKVEKDMARKAKFSQRLQIIQDRTKSYITNELSAMFAPETYDDMKNYVDVSNNIAKRIFSELSTVYKNAPDRKVTPAKSDKRYQGVVDDMDLDAKMQKVNFLLNGLNDLILMPAIYGNRFDLNIFTPDKVTVFEDPDNPTQIMALLIHDEVTDVKGEPVKQYYFWSPLRHFIFDERFEIQVVFGNEEMLNPYFEENIRAADGQTEIQFYPFVFLHNSARCYSFWDEETGNDVFEAFKWLCIQNTFINFMFPMQFKQIAVEQQTIDTGNNQSIKNPQTKSPLHVLQANGQITVLDWQSQLSQLKEIVESKMYQIGSNYGISAENFKLTAQATSGFARLIAKERLLEVRAQQTKTYSHAENDIFNSVALATRTYQMSDAISETAKFQIDFAEEREIEDPQLEINILRQRIDMGLTNVLDVIKSQNPDIKTDEAAEEALTRNIEIRNRLQNKFSGLFKSVQTPQGAANVG